MLMLHEESMENVTLSGYAVGRFLERSRLLGLEGNEADLRQLLSTACPETRPKSRAVRLHFLKRKTLRGNALYLVAGGWRFVVRQGRLVTVERIQPHENYPRGEGRVGYADEGSAGRKAA
jgi:hypothetical protein